MGTDVMINLPDFPVHAAKLGVAAAALQVRDGVEAGAGKPDLGQPLLGPRIGRRGVLEHGEPLVLQELVELFGLLRRPEEYLVLGQPDPADSFLGEPAAVELVEVVMPEL
ncbi:hypothetical protein VTK56DRAFT_1528 [Thermocarpiscus australiensis]